MDTGWAILTGDDMIKTVGLLLVILTPRLKWERMATCFGNSSLRALRTLTPMSRKPQEDQLHEFEINQRNSVEIL